MDLLVVLLLDRRGCRLLLSACLNGARWVLPAVTGVFGPQHVRFCRVPWCTLVRVRLGTPAVVRSAAPSTAASLSNLSVSVMG